MAGSPEPVACVVFGLAATSRRRWSGKKSARSHACVCGGLTTMQAAADEFGLPPKLARTVEAMQALPSDRVRYQQLLALAGKLPDMPEEDMVDANKVPGCLSTVHVTASLQDDGTVKLAGNSDAVMSKGLVALLILGLQGCTPSQVVAVKPEFIKACGITASLTPGRNNGFFNMLKLIQKKTLDLERAAESARAAKLDVSEQGKDEVDEEARAEEHDEPSEGGLHIYNTLTRSKEPFVTLEEGVVNMYVCGMTVYDLCHLGHARIMVFFDFVTKYLEFEGYKVKYVRNITDVDDKIIARSAQTGEEPQALADRMADEMRTDAKSLGCELPTVEPKATQHIGEIVEFIESLIQGGHAYPGPSQPLFEGDPRVPRAPEEDEKKHEAEDAPRDVYFALRSFPTYGRLSRCSIEGNLAGARVEVSSGKRAPEDFVLWKGAKPGEPSWSSPWGPGRPGWHIECSAMAKKHLGVTLDIHGGGPDLVFPHHENEIAQSEALHGGKPYVKTWMHCASVRSTGNEKMSKSLGNFVTIRDALEKYDGEAIRFYLLSSQYRQPLLFAMDSLAKAQERLLRLYTALRGIPPAEGGHSTATLSSSSTSSSYWTRFLAALRNDLDTVTAISIISEVARELLNIQAQSSRDVESQPPDPEQVNLAAQLRQMGAIFGILQQDPEVVLRGGGGAADDDVEGGFEKRVEELVAERDEARKSRNFTRADEIREELTALGVVLEDSRGKAGPTRWRVAAPRV